MARYRVLSLLLLVVLALVAALGGAPEQAHGGGGLALPTDFVDEVVVGGLLAPRAFVWAPDGRLLIAERGSDTSKDINFGSIRIARPDPSNPGKYILGARAVTFNVCGDGERGFLGLALDPNFDTNGYVYTYYTRQLASSPPCAGNYGSTAGQPNLWTRNRVSRWTMVGDTISPSSEKVLIDNIPSGGIHNAGDLQFDAAGNLYISVGDAYIEPSPAQDNTSLNGKILRIRPDAAAPNGYTIPGDNPFASAAGARLCGTIPRQSGSGPCKEIYASGFRNPFRIAVQPGTNQVFAFDVGGGAWEEVDAVVLGGDHGWPAREGPCPSGVNCTPGTPSGYVDPIYSYYHDSATGSTDAAVIGGAVYTGDAYPAEYRNNLFFADFARGWVRRLVYNSSSGVWSAQPFGSGVSGIIGVRTGPDTNLFYLEYSDNGIDPTSALHRIRYQSGVNQAPVAALAATPRNGPVPLTVTFSGAGSYDPEGRPLTCLWDFGGGDTAEAPCSDPQTRTYATRSPRTITLRARDDGSPTDPTPKTSDPVSITVYPGNAPPQGNIQLDNLTDPGRGTTYYAGDTFRFTAVGLSDDTGVSGLQLRWKVVFHHETHTHPFLDDAGSGASGQFTIPTGGETSPIVWYRVHLTITDSDGQSTEVVRDVTPVTTQLNLASVPTGATLRLDVQTVTTPATLTRVVGIQTSLDAPPLQRIGGDWFGFPRLSGGPPAGQALTVPPGGATYTVRYQPVVPVFVPEAHR
jgi:glucose/arabinose dehydrogenase